MRSALIFAAAPLEPTPRLRARLPKDAYVVAADGGARIALAFGYTPDVVLGDFDSLDPTSFEHLPLERFPRDKDQTDGQLALDRALATQPAELYLLGFLGGPRLDMAFANVLLLLRATPRTFLLDERNEATLIREAGHYAWMPEPDEVVSIVPLTADATVTTQGLRWPLKAERLERGDTRGLSNEPVSNLARVEVHTGAALLTRHFARV